MRVIEERTFIYIFSHYPEAILSVQAPLFLFPWDKTNIVDEILLWKTLLETVQNYYF
jgi:hypothetical protein